MDSDDSSNFEQRLDQFRKQDEDKYIWVKELSKEVTELTQKFRVASIDLRSERDARRSAQEREEELLRKYQALNGCLERNSFVLVLIDADADGYIFNEKYILEGANGGVKAAHDLKAALRDYLVTVSTALVDLPLMVRAYANLDGLSNALRRAGMSKGAKQLPMFARGFSQAGELFDFIAVGSGKDRADHKIRGAFKQFVGNPTCKHVVFGACHDNGYVRDLEGFAPDEGMRGRITLLKSFETGREFSSLPFLSTRLDSIFQDRPLPGFLKPSPPIEEVTTSLPEPATRQTTLTMTTLSMLFAVRGTDETKTSHTPPAATQTKMIPEVEPGHIIINAVGERVDSPLPQASSAVVDQFHDKARRVGGKGYCNSYQLFGRCPGRKSCKYSHQKLSESELLVLKSRVRAQICKTGLKCRDSECIYGHNCKCSVHRCAFSKKMHQVDTSNVKVLKVK